MRFRSWAFVTLASLAFMCSPVAAAADDGPTLYKQLCASCHDAGTERAPNRDALRAMTVRYRELMHSNEPVHTWPLD